MKDPILTLVIIHSCELDSSYLEHCLAALGEWNSEVMSQVEVIVVPQIWDVNMVRICEQQLFEVELLCIEHKRADNYYPIWDVLEELRLADRYVHGEYVCIMHSEFLWCKSRMQSTLSWLINNQPILALGNLRRPGDLSEKTNNVDHPGCNKEKSDIIIRDMLTASRNIGAAKTIAWDQAAWRCELCPTTSWFYWSTATTSGDTNWVEDLFFANVAWLRAWHAFEHGGVLPFQDVWDLMGEAIKVLDGNGFGIKIQKMPVEVNKVIHLWHPKVWGSWTEEVRDWFLRDMDTWQSTPFSDGSRWNSIIANKTNWAPVADFRNCAGGTVRRYGIALKQWLSDHGKELTQFYTDNKIGQRKR